MSENNLSPRLRLPIPRRDEDPYYEGFLALIDALDAQLYGPSHEDRNILLQSTATVSLDSGGTLTWTASIDLLSGPTGFLWQVPAGSISLADGEILYVQLTRAPLNTMTVAAVKGNRAPQPGDEPGDTLVLAVRRGNVVFWRNGATLAVGISAPIFSGGGGGGGVMVQVDGTGIGTQPTLNFVGAVSGVDDSGGNRVVLTLPRRGVLNEFWTRRIPLAIGRDTESLSWVTLGHRACDPNEFLVTGTSVTVRLEVSGYSSVAGTSGQVELVNLDDASSTFVAVSGTTPTTLLTTVTLTAGMYRLRYRAVGSTGPAERFFLDSANLLIRNTLTE